MESRASALADGIPLAIQDDLNSEENSSSSSRSRSWLPASRSLEWQRLEGPITAILRDSGYLHTGEAPPQSIDRMSLLTNRTAIAADIRKKLPSRRVTVRRRVMSGYTTVSAGHYGHVGIGVKITQDHDGRHIITSVSVVSP